MRSLKVILLSVLFSNCAHLQSGPADENIFMPAKAIPDKFWDGEKVEKSWREGMLFYRVGKDKDGNCILTRTQLERMADVLVYRMSGVTETCKGKDCSYCGFKTSGGCECRNSLNTCEHTITRNRDLMALR